MKTRSNFRFLPALIVSCFLVIGSLSNSSAQISGLYFYVDIDSTGHGCVDDTINGGWTWSNSSGSYVLGDDLDLNIDWGDGNVDALPNNTMIINGSTAYIPWM